MPFTPSHAVVALAFVRTPLVPAAIAVGAMTPDLPLFVRLGWPDYAFTHSLVGIPATVVVALLLLLVWRCVLRGAVEDLTPDVVARRVPLGWRRGVGDSLRETFSTRRASTPRVSGAGILVLAASLAIGIASHTAWDAFTHEGRVGSDLVPVLAQQWGPVAGYKWLQHGSSAVGLALLAGWCLVRLVRTQPHPPVRATSAWVRIAVWAALPALMGIGWAAGLVVWGPLTPEWTVNHLAYRVLPPMCALWGALLLVTAAVVQWRRRRDTPGMRRDLAPPPGAA